MADVCDEIELPDSDVGAEDNLYLSGEDDGRRDLGEAAYEEDLRNAAANTTESRSFADVYRPDALREYDENEEINGPE